jgi:hypothetical protein
MGGLGEPRLIAEVARWLTPALSDGVYSGFALTAD